MSLKSNGSQKTSKCGKNISDTLSYTLCATFLFLPHFEVICDLLLNRRAATQNLQCSSDISEPKYTRNTCLPNTRINVCKYAHTCIQYMRVCLISMYELTYCFFYSYQVIVSCHRARKSFHYFEYAYSVYARISSD